MDPVTPHAGWHGTLALQVDAALQKLRGVDSQGKNHDARVITSCEGLLGLAIAHYLTLAASWDPLEQDLLVYPFSCGQLCISRAYY